ncbi:MAG: anthranilate synthase component I family protein [Phycisphaerales bacterium]
MPKSLEIPADPEPLAPEWAFSPAEAVRRWPVDTALACVALPSWAGNPGRWTLLTRADAPAWNRADLTTLFRDIPDAFPAASNTAGWFFALDYEAGFEIEPAALVHRATVPSSGQCRTSEDAPPPRTLQTTALTGGPVSGTATHAAVLPYRAAYLHHAETNRWFTLGDPRSLPDLAALPTRHETWHAAHPRPTPGQGRAWYEAAVARCIDLIRAGDLFQANLAHRLECPFEGSARALFAAVLEQASPHHAAYLDLPHKTVVSASPELFLEADFAAGGEGAGRVSTRPIKGTSRAEHATQLETSEKDRAELVMITDLMRNDLGRVATFGTVRVDAPRRLERHGPIVHTSAGVSARLRPGVTPLDLLRATFPAGSITGAPKVRAMQVIDELEHSAPRGSYCGTIGVLSATGHSIWSVAIRTATISSGLLTYPVGAGIVEGSDPALEWEETLHKAEEFTSILMNPPALTPPTNTTSPAHSRAKPRPAKVRS